jgi:HPt (histidine-containing phosphotransfer) domain-containing protein
MDDILLKPFQKADLAALLGRWLPEKAGGRRDAAEEDDGGLIPIDEPGMRDTEAREAPAASVDPSVFDWEGVLDTFLGQKETVVSLLGRFTEKAVSQIEELREAKAAKDFSRFREAAHSMKGAAWNLSARRLGDAAHLAETAGRNGDAEAATTSFEAVVTALEAFRKAVQPYIKG